MELLITIIRLYENQNDSWIIIINIMDNARVVVVGRIDLNDIGSNAEKISIIIKIWHSQLELWRFLV